MTRYSRIRTLCAALLAATATACYSASDESGAGGHTNWLECASLPDCPSAAEAAECSGGYCLDDAGQRIPATSIEDAGAAPPQVPSDWVSIDARCGYAFRAPPDVREEPAQGLDSCVDRYVTEACVYSGGYGAFGTDWGFESYPEYGQTQQQVDGLSATVFTARVDGDEEGRGPYWAAIDFVPNPEGLYLSMFATCSTAAGRDEALLVFQTIERPPPQP